MRPFWQSQPPEPPINHSFAFDPTYGYDLEALLQVPAPEEPADFVNFWQGLYEDARKVSTHPQRQIARTTRDFEVYDIEYTSLDGVRIGGWLTLPRRGTITRGVVVGHGYGGREMPEPWLPMSQTAAIFPCMRGQSRSRRQEIAHEAAGHVLHGINSRYTYVHGGCVADIWCAASALIAMAPEATEHLNYMGVSFGGGIGALALPWDQRFQSAYLGVPSFGNHPLRLTLPCIGSGESLRTYRHDHPEIVETLCYFDAAIAARHLHIPTLVSAALFDPAVPPPGQFAVYNALPGPKELFVLSAGHFDYPASLSENRRLQEALKTFFGSTH